MEIKAKNDKSIVILNKLATSGWLFPSVERNLIPKYNIKRNNKKVIQFFPIFFGASSEPDILLLFKFINLNFKKNETRFKRKIYKKRRRRN